MRCGSTWIHTYYMLLVHGTGCRERKNHELFTTKNKRLYQILWAPDLPFILQPLLRSTLRFHSLLVRRLRRVPNARWCVVRLLRVDIWRWYSSWDARQGLFGWAFLSEPVTWVSSCGQRREPGDLHGARRISEQEEPPSKVLHGCGWHDVWNER